MDISVVHPAGNLENYVFPTGKLNITVLKARGIRGDEIHGFGKADPYATIKVGGRDHGQTARTTIQKNAGGKPVWNQVFTFPIRSQHEEYNQLQIVLYNKNHWPRKDTVIGYVSMKNMCYLLRLNGDSVQETWYPVYYGEEGALRGEIFLGFNFILMVPSKLLTETVLVMGDAGPDVPSHREIDWANMAQLVSLGIGAAHVGLVAAAL